MRDIEALLLPEDRLNILLVGQSAKPATFMNVAVNSKSAYAVCAVHTGIMTLLEKMSVEYSQTLLKSDSIAIYCGATSDDLDRIVDANHKCDDWLTGKALGYPEVSLDSYCDPENPRRADPDFFSELLDASLAGIQIPYWVGYISHLPSICDLINGAVCGESKEIGNYYRDVVAQVAPDELILYDRLAESKVPRGYRLRVDGKKQFFWN